MLKANADGTLAQAHTANMQLSLGLPDGYAVLHAACHAGNAEVVEYLLSCRQRRRHTAGDGSSPRDDPGVGGTWTRWMSGQRWSGDRRFCGGFLR